MSTWEDELDDLPAVPAPVEKSNWEDEDVDDVKDEWDASSDEEKEEQMAKEQAAPPQKKKKSVAQAAAERQAAEEKKRKELEEKRNAMASAEANEDPRARRERLRQLELEADMANATDLFAGVSTDDKDAVDGADELALENMAPKTKEQFDEFQKRLVDVIGKHKRTGLYPSFVDSFARQLCLDLKVEDIRKVASTLTSLSNERLKASKDVGKKRKSTKKTITGGKAEMGLDTTDYGAYDDYDDFM